MLARASRRRCRAFTSSLRVTTLKPPSRHSCQTGESRTPPSRRDVASTATSGCRSRSPSSARVRAFRTQYPGAEVRLLEILVDRLAVAAVGALEGAHLEVLEHAHAREQPPAFRRLGDAPLDDVVGGGMRDVAALEANPSAPRAVEPVDRAERRRLAGAVRADQRHDLARLDLDRDALQRLDRAVVGVHILDLEDVLRLRVHAPDCPWSACLPRYASITRLSFCT